MAENHFPVNPDYCAHCTTIGSTEVYPDDLPLTVVRHVAPRRPADVPVGDGWVGAVVTIISGPVVGSLVRTIDAESQTVHHEAHIDLDGHTSAGVAAVALDDQAALRSLAVVAERLADELGEQQARARHPAGWAL